MAPPGKKAAAISLRKELAHRMTDGKQALTIQDIRVAAKKHNLSNGVALSTAVLMRGPRFEAQFGTAVRVTNVENVLIFTAATVPPEETTLARVTDQITSQRRHFPKTWK